jgi:lysozyme
MATEIASVGDLIAQNEGCRLEAYQDTVGIWTLGYGHTDGVEEGHACSQAEANSWLSDDILIAKGAAATLVGPNCWATLNDPRRAALTDMAFNLGQSRLAKFLLLLAAVRTANWGAAQVEAINSEWAKQVGQRAVIDARMLLTGEWPVPPTAT